MDPKILVLESMLIIHLWIKLSIPLHSFKYRYYNLATKKKKYRYYKIIIIIIDFFVTKNGKIVSKN